MSALLQVTDLVVEFSQRGWHREPFRAVDDVSFEVAVGETVGLVGESGSGKTTIGRAVLGLTPAANGSIRYDGREIAGATRRVRRNLASELQAIFQDPYSSLDPLRTVGQSIAEGLHRLPDRERASAQIEDRLERVGLPRNAGRRYPRAFSGGQRQRIAIARALAVEPRLIVCDEPLSALDLSTQAQVLNLLRELQGELGVAYLFIAHNLEVVRYLSQRVLVLYRGQIMEAGSAVEVCDAPLHPYSQALWASSPIADPSSQSQRRKARAAVVRATTSASASPPAGGCPFTPRCPHAHEVCSMQRPIAAPVDGRTVACHMFDPQSGHAEAGGGLTVLAAASQTEKGPGT